MKIKKKHLRDCDTWEILGQTKWWVIGSGDPIRRSDMDLVHKVNTLAWLVRNARRIVPGPLDFSGVWLSAPDDVIAELEQMAADPEEWVVATPFVRAMLNDILDAGDEDL